MECVAQEIKKIPYSGKFSLVQNFAELPSSPSEENSSLDRSVELPVNTLRSGRMMSQTPA